MKLTFKKVLIAIFVILVGTKYMLSKAEIAEPRFVKIGQITSAERIRLSCEMERARLFFAQAEKSVASNHKIVTVISSVFLGENKGVRENFRIEHLLPGTVEWDIADFGGPYPIAVLGQFGGAVNALELSRENKFLPLTDFNSSEDYRDPRFSKNDTTLNQPKLITSIVNEKQVVLLRPDGPEKFMTPQVILNEQQLDSAMILQTSEGRYLLFKKFVIGPRRKEFPGILSAVMLDQNFQVTGKVVYPLGEQLIFEFDADVKDSRLAIVATTEYGFAITIGKDLLKMSKRMFNHRPELSQPALVLSKHEAVVVFQELIDSEFQSIVMTNIPF